MTETAVLDQSADLLITLFRVWARSRTCHDNPLPAMYDHGARFGTAPELVPACQSCFALTEACLGRCLHAGVAMRDALTRDELALLLMLQHAPATGPTHGSESVPHGLPGALCWASFAVMRALGEAVLVHDTDRVAMPPAHECPFEMPTPRAA